MSTDGRVARVRLAWLLAFVLSTITLADLAPAPRAGKPQRAGRRGPSLSKVLQDLQSQGLRILFSSDLVRPEMRVDDRPAAGTPRERLDDLLAPHGLAATDGPGNTILVVRTASAVPTTGGIRGEVRSRAGAAIAGARVRIAQVPADFVADRRGAFSWSGLAPGSYLLHARAPGFLPQDFTDVAVQAGETTEIHIVLNPIGLVTEEVRVRLDPPPLAARHPEARQTLTREEILEAPAVADDVLRLAGRLPGAGGDDTGAALNVRGGAGDEILILLDGLEVAQPFHLQDRGGLISIIDSAAVGRVDFLGGSFPAEYGGRMSGVLELSSAMPAEDVTTGIGLGTSQARLQSRGTFLDDRGRWSVSGRRGEPRAALDLAGADASYEPLYYDLLQRLEFRLGSHTTLAGNLLLTGDHLEHRGDQEEAAEHGGTELDSRYQDHYAWLNLESDWSPGLHSRIVLSLARVEARRNVFQGSDLEVLDRRSAEVYTLKQDWTYDVSKTQFLKWGAAYSRSSARYDYSASGTDDDPLLGLPVALDRQSRLDPTGEGLSLYVADRIQAAPGVLAEVGLRVERHAYATFAESTLSPRFDLAWEPGPHDTLRFGWGYFYQPQRIQDLQVEDGVEEFFAAQLAEHRTVGWEHTYASNLKLRLSAYQKQMSRLQPRYENLFDAFGFSPETGADRVRVAPSAARTQGVEIGLGASVGPAVRWWADYALAHAADRIDGVDVPRNWDQLHTLTFGLNRLIGTRWSIALAGTAHSGRPTTAVSAQGIVQPDGSVVIVPILGPRNGERLEWFQRLDLRVLRNLDLRNSRIRLFVDVTNLLDRENACCAERFDYLPQADGSIAVDRLDHASLSRVVAGGLTWEF